MATVRFQSIEVFGGNPAMVADLQNMIDSDAGTSGTITGETGVSTGVLLKDPLIEGSVSGLTEITFQVEWRDLTASKASEIASIYRREGDGAEWVEMFSQEITTLGWITTSLTVPITNLADLQILIEYYFGPSGTAPPDPPPEWQG